MVANLFRNSNFTALVLGGICCFVIFLLSSQQPLLPLFDQYDIWTSGFVKAITLSFFLFFLMVIENKYRHISFGSIHALSFVLVLLFLPGEKLSYSGLIILFLLLLTYHNLALVNYGKKPEKALFNSQFIFAGLTLFHPFFAGLFICSLGYFTILRFQTLKFVLLFLLPIALILFLGVTLEAFFNIPVFQNFSGQIQFQFKELSLESIFWISFMAFVVFLHWSGMFKERKMGFGTANYFMLILLLISTSMSLFIENAPLNTWEMCFLPIAFILGNYLDQSRIRRIHALLIFLLIIKITFEVFV